MEGRITAGEVSPIVPIMNMLAPSIHEPLKNRRKASVRSARTEVEQPGPTKTTNPLWHRLVTRARTSGGPAPTGNALPVQAKLTIGAPNDQYEQEADRAADQVMRMPERLRVGAGDAASGSAEGPAVEGLVQRDHGNLPGNVVQRQTEPADSQVFICSKDLDTAAPLKHAFFRVGGAGKGNTTYSLQPIDQGSDCWQGVPGVDYASDVDAEADCQPTTIALSCLREQNSAYPQGRYCTLGPNSNTYVGYVAKQCGMTDVDPPGRAPGLHSTPPAADTFAADKWHTLFLGCTSKPCERGPDGQARPIRRETRYLGGGAVLGSDSIIRQGPGPKL